MSEEDKIGVDTEIEILNHIDHPNVIKFINVVEDDKYLYLV